MCHAYPIRQMAFNCKSIVFRTNCFLSIFEVQVPSLLNETIYDKAKFSKFCKFLIFFCPFWRFLANLLQSVVFIEDNRNCNKLRWQWIFIARFPNVEVVKTIIRTLEKERDLRRTKISRDKFKFFISRVFWARF